VVAGVVAVVVLASQAGSPYRPRCDQRLVDLSHAVSVRLRLTFVSNFWVRPISRTPRAFCAPHRAQLLYGASM